MLNASHMIFSIRRRRRLWVFLFIWAATLLVILATGWNVVLVRDYWKMVDLARGLHLRQDSTALAPWPIVILGSLGFAATMATIVLFFIKLLKEMKLNQIQSEFLATVSHELKTPIASIELTSSLLRSGGLLAEETARLWDSQQLELRRLRREVETILEAARWDAKPAAMKFRILDLEHWLGESMHRWRTLLGEGAELVREGEPLPQAVRLDPRHLDLITDNLIENARKFARGRPSVVIRTSRTNPGRPWKTSHWRIDFRDHGWGFDPSEAKKIFDRFYRGGHEAPYSIPGTGLGLYLASTASHAMGIALSSSSDGAGKGAVFTLEGNEIPEADR